VTYKNITILKFKAVCPVLVHTRYPYYQIPCRKAVSRDRQKLAASSQFQPKINTLPKWLAEKHCPCFSVPLIGAKQNGKKSLAARFNPCFLIANILGQLHKTKAKQHGPCFIIH